MAYQFSSRIRMHPLCFFLQNNKFASCISQKLWLQNKLKRQRYMQFENAKGRKLTVLLSWFLWFPYAMFSLLFFTPNPGVWTSAVWVEPALYLLVLISFLEISLKRILKRNPEIRKINWALGGCLKVRDTTTVPIENRGDRRTPFLRWNIDSLSGSGLNISEAWDRHVSGPSDYLLYPGDACSFPVQFMEIFLS